MRERKVEARRARGKVVVCSLREKFRPKRRLDKSKRQINFHVCVNFGLFKRFNGYKPFLYNQTIDACYFINHQKSNPVAKYFFDIIRGITNLNHSCPYNHDILVDRLSTEIVNHHLTKVLPYPDGDYMLETRWILNDIPSAVTQVYLSLS
nr:uncharacterized protein LOC108016521 isoform X2 [Drosophila suzukii]